MKMKRLMKNGFTFVSTLVLANAVSAACVEQYDRLKPNHLYTVDANGNVTDQETGLMWHSCPFGTTWNAGSCDGSAAQLNWYAALTISDAASAGYAGETGWRLPNKKELASLMDKSCQSPAINTMFFPLVDIRRSWTSTVKIGNDAKAWAISYSVGDDILLKKVGTAAVYIVRN